jgi:hypothetical protein
MVQGLELAGIGRRYLGAPIDLLLFLLVAIAYGVVLAVSGRSDNMSDAGFWLLYLLALFGDHVVGEWLVGRSLGKWVLGIRVVDAGDQAKQRAVPVEAPRPPLFHHLEPGLVVPVDQFVGDLPGRRLLSPFERVFPEPLHVHDGDGAGGQDAANGGIGLEVFELQSHGPVTGRDTPYDFDCWGIWFLRRAVPVYRIVRSCRFSTECAGRGVDHFPWSNVQEVSGKARPA